MPARAKTIVAVLPSAGSGAHSVARALALGGHRVVEVEQPAPSRLSTSTRPTRS